MKNFKLLLATTALLSMGAVANADTTLEGNQTKLRMRVSVVQPINVVMEQVLGFGIILADSGGRTVTVTTEGLDEAHTSAVLLSSATHRNGDYSNYPSYTETSTSPLNPGKFRFNGLPLEMGMVTLNDNFLNDFMKVSFSETTALTDRTTSTTCGTVDGFNTRFAIEDGSVVGYIGGTFHTADLSGITGFLDCVGETTVTAIFDNAAIQSFYDD